MTERPRAPESLVEKFSHVTNAEQLLKVIDGLPKSANFLLSDAPMVSDVAPRGKDDLRKLLAAIFSFAEASSLRTGTDVNIVADREVFLGRLITESIIDDGAEAEALIGAVRRAVIDQFPEYGNAPSGNPVPPEAEPTEGLTISQGAREALSGLGYPESVINSMSVDQAQVVLDAGFAYVKPKVVARPKTPPAAPKNSPAAPAAPTPTTPAPADLSKLMPKKPEPATPDAVVVASVAGGVAAMGAGTETVASVLDNSPEFRAFFAKAPNAEAVLERQDVAELGLYKKAFEIKDKLATDLYDLANGAIKGDFLLDFENPASNLPKNAREEFQKYVNAEALERPEQLINLAMQLETRQVLEKNIATAKAEVERLGGKDFFEQAEREALEMKQHLDRAHESTRRDSLAGYVPHALQLGFLKVAHKINEWVGWKGQTEDTVRTEFKQKRETLLNGRSEADLMAWEKLAMDKIAQEETLRLVGLKRHEALGARMLEVSQQGVSREKLKAAGVNLGLGSAVSYSPFWVHHPEIAREFEAINGRLADIRRRKQTIEQAERNFADITAQFEAIRTSTYAELPPTITLVRYAQVQVRNTLTSFVADSAPEDLQRIYDYGAFLVENQDQTKNVGVNTGKSAFDSMTTAELNEAGRKLHESIVAQWGKRVLEVFTKANLNKKGAIAEMEKVVKGIMKQSALGGLKEEADKAQLMKDLLTEAFKKIDPTKGDGKERRLALMGVMISCGLLKKGDKITT